jgi:hypothetical protein
MTLFICGTPAIRTSMLLLGIIFIKLVCINHPIRRLPFFMASGLYFFTALKVNTDLTLKRLIFR